jgi:hypothetical protein
VSWLWVLVSTLIFAMVHFLTNRVDPAQALGWVAGGTMLALVYLMNGSIWVPVLLHFATDLTNVLVFNITGRQSLFAANPELSSLERFVFRMIQVLAVLGMAAAWYGPQFSLPLNM